jgi:hypothetical protein
VKPPNGGMIHALHGRGILGQIDDHNLHPVPGGLRQELTQALLRAVTLLPENDHSR